ncbi:Nitrogen permease regulator 2 [Vermiconidia calcicola]|uniref:Nitrogen permease regulator 2 n=1 Tax=Vermiconidia calcicola TaxID=1690605 RepID=A0ACC3NUB3_9PEZI|nr:Nitrogen permease regulator 2 [Vermiconidia calcicola]
MLEGIFYARFHPERGPSIIHQYPKASVIAPDCATKDALLSFSDISSYVIPPYELCNRPLSVCAGGKRVLSYPISLEDSKYERNRFTFNVCFILGEHEDARPWERVVRKTATFFTELEEEDGILQAEELLNGLKWAGDDAYPAEDIGVVYTMLESVLQDLNAYAETCVRIDALHVLNLRLEATKVKPPKVRAWDVPLLIRSLPTHDQWTWDLALQRIHSYMDGTKHVQRIAELADVELKLVKKAVRELLYHARVMLLDIFHFQAIFALTSDFSCFVKDDAMLLECSGYVAADPAKNILHSTPDLASEQAHQPFPTKQAIVSLYRDLSPGVSLHDFCLSHEPELSRIDIRRFITFGVIKGFLRRVHKYALAVASQPTLSRKSRSNGSSTKAGTSSEEVEKEWDRAWKRAAFSSGWATPPVETAEAGSMPKRGSESGRSADAQEVSSQDDRLMEFLDGKHCMDEMCVSMHMSEKKIVERLRSGKYGEVVFFCR